MNYGLRDQDISSLRAVFARYRAITTVMLYGSRARNTYKPYSNINFALKGANITDELLERIEEDLDDLLLPFKIDLKNFNAINDLEQKTEIMSFGTVFYQA
ncbi:DNA polymerase [Campylobacterota bacterium]|nr:DNA polymerase [Campylobacterota bacterium]